MPVAQSPSRTLSPITRDVKASAPMIDASIVVPAFNEEKFIHRCLDSLCRIRTDKRFEVIVVDNNSTDGTRSVVEEYSDRLNLKIVMEKQQGIGAARASGFREAMGKVILSTDADTEVYPSWLDDFVDILNADEEVVAVTGISKIHDCSWHVNFIYNNVKPLFSKRLYRLVFGHYIMLGASFAVKRQAYLASGGFDPLVNAHEDVYISWKLCKVGKTRLISRPAVTFSGRRFQKGLLRVFLNQTGTFTSQFLLKKDIRKSDIR